MRATAKIVLVFMVFAFMAAAGAQPRPGGGGGGTTGGAGGSGAGTQGGLVTFVQHELLARIFNDAGIKSTVENLKNGGRVVKMQIWPNTYSAAYPIFCKKDGTECGGYQIFVNLGNTNVSDPWMKSWNAKYVLVRTYKLDNGEQIFQLDEITQGGVTPQNIALAAAVFKQIVEESTDFKP
jgi:hypothetical protein